MNPELLPEELLIPARLRSRLERDYDFYASDELPSAWEQYVLEEYELDVGATFAGLPVKNPFGRQSGPFSKNLVQVRDDALAGLGFVVLKTVAACDAAGAQVIQDWNILRAEPTLQEIEEKGGQKTFSLTWTECGWHENLEAYLRFMRASFELGASHRMVIAPSLRFPVHTTIASRSAALRHTLHVMLETWHSLHPDRPMPLELNVLPDGPRPSRSSQRLALQRALSSAPRILRAETPVTSQLHLGLKVPNADEPETFQLRLLHAALHGATKPDFLVLSNRFLRPAGRRNARFLQSSGGPTLAARNLRVLDEWRTRHHGQAPTPFSALGHIVTGRVAVEYALRGATSLQLATALELPDSACRRKEGTRGQRAMHELIFHPRHGLVAAMLHVREQTGLHAFRDLAEFRPNLIARGRPP